MSEDWKQRIVRARQMAELRKAPIAARTEMGRAFRRLVLTAIEPAFKEVARFANEHGADCRVECALNGVQPRAMFFVRPSGRSIRYEMDADGNAVREVEGVYYRAVGQRLVWRTVDELSRQLTASYARSAAAALVQEHFRQIAEAS